MLFQLPIPLESLIAQLTLEVGLVGVLRQVFVLVASGIEPFLTDGAMIWVTSVMRIDVTFEVPCVAEALQADVTGSSVDFVRT